MISLLIIILIGAPYSSLCFYARFIIILYQIG
nr:MAG TPA: hypothetical protein [Caudoviricetes sp.]